MRVLAIDTALEACAAAVLDTEHGRMASESLPMVRGHAEALMPLIERVMQQADMSFAALDRVGVTTGPGSFTGLRVGIAAARGIALAAQKPAVGLSTLAAYAAPLIATALFGAYKTGMVIAVYILACAVVTVIAVSFMRERARVDISQEYGDEEAEIPVTSRAATRATAPG